MMIRNFIVALARKFIDAPYLWGGSHPWLGFDCSGFAIFILQVFGLFPPQGDATAQMLANMFEPTFSPEPGDLCFYGADENHIVHVMLYLNGGCVIGAAGGDHTITTIELARKRGAGVQVKPVGYRKDFLGYRNILVPIPNLRDGTARLEG